MNLCAAGAFLPAALACSCAGLPGEWAAETNLLPGDSGKPYLIAKMSARGKLPELFNKQFKNLPGETIHAVEDTLAMPDVECIANLISGTL